ncbi:MAG: hypothetical protein M3R24_32180 [Chloroflexota bacterium]|nr:hypothetical protein [Chloroflexota bacterium]
MHTIMHMEVGQFPHNALHVHNIWRQSLEYNIHAAWAGVTAGDPRYLIRTPGTLKAAL